MREDVMVYYNDQIMDNLISAKNNLLFVRRYSKPDFGRFVASRRDNWSWICRLANRQVGAGTKINLRSTEAKFECRARPCRRSAASILARPRSCATPVISVASAQGRQRSVQSAGLPATSPKQGPSAIGRNSRRWEVWPRSRAARTPGPSRLSKRIQ
jgi:hypothetical protein